MNSVTEPGLLRQGHTKVQIPSSPPVEVIGMGSKVREEAERESLRLLRATFRYRIPVESAAIAQDLGIQVLDLELEESTLGALLLKPEKDPRIVLNERHSVLRRRLTCALELGHYVRRSADTNAYRRIDRCDWHATSGADSEELFAHEFAACLLMPKVKVEVFADMGMDDLDMAMRFLVPREAMQIRLRGLGLPAPDLEQA
jgi:Zn-dependent peptidase ImmA (M78 family)